MYAHLASLLFAPLIARTTGRWLPGPLALWGKLPGHADEVNCGTPPQDAQAWQAWVAQYWCEPVVPRPRRQKSPASSDLQDVPVAFALQLPGPWLAGSMVRGVIIGSSDPAGQAHPLVIYQRVQVRWLLGEPVESTGQDLTYWLARLMLRWQRAGKPLPALVRALELLNAASAPGWRQVKGKPPKPLPFTFWQTVLDELDKDELPDPTHGLRGSAKAPSLHAGRPLFWQQDGLGGYLRSAGAWSQLWEA